MVRDSDALFLRELKAGHHWQLWTAFQFLKEGFTVQAPPLRIRPTQADSDNYSDNGDIFVWSNHQKLRFECKSRNLSFTSKHDYPYPTIIVERAGTWERKANSKPSAILLISRETSSILAVGVWTEREWWTETKTDYAGRREYYLAPASVLMGWQELLQHIKGKLL